VAYHSASALRCVPCNRVSGCLCPRIIPSGVRNRCIFEGVGALSFSVHSVLGNAGNSHPNPNPAR
jgi:hypothetical protein